MKKITKKRLFYTIIVGTVLFFATLFLPVGIGIWQGSGALYLTYMIFFTTIFEMITQPAYIDKSDFGFSLSLLLYIIPHLAIVYGGTYLFFRSSITTEKNVE